MLAQPLAVVESEQRHVAGGFLDDFAADDGAVLVVDEFGSPADLRAGQTFGFRGGVFWHSQRGWNGGRGDGAFMTIGVAAVQARG